MPWRPGTVPVPIELSEVAVVDGTPLVSPIAPSSRLPR